MEKENNFELEDTQKDRYLTFKVEDETYGFEIKYVTEIIGMQAITKVPDLEDYIKGIINLRGKIIPVIELRVRFKKPLMKYDDRTCIIVIEFEDITVGFIVDEVEEVIVIGEENITEPPKTKTGFKNPFIKGIGKVNEKMKLILDCQELLDEKVNKTV